MLPTQTAGEQQALGSGILLAGALDLAFVEHVYGIIALDSPLHRIEYPKF